MFAPHSVSLLAFADAAGAAVPGYQTAIFAAILVLTLGLLAAEKIHKTILVLLSAGVCLFLADALGYFPHGGGHHLPVYIEMIEYEVIGIVIGATVFAEIAASRRMPAHAAFWRPVPASAPTSSAWACGLGCA